MGIKEIIAKIQEEGAREVEGIKEQYQQQLANLQKKQEEEQNLYYNTQLESIQKEAEDVKRGYILSAKLEKRKKVLQAKRNLINKVLEEAQTNLQATIGKEKYLAFLKQGINKAQEGDTVLLSPADLKSFSEELKKSGPKNLVFKEANIKGGIIIEKKNFSYNFSVEALVEQKKEELEKDIGNKLHVL